MYCAKRKISKSFNETITLLKNENFQNPSLNSSKVLCVPRERKNVIFYWYTTLQLSNFACVCSACWFIWMASLFPQPSSSPRVTAFPTSEELRFATNALPLYFNSLHTQLGLLIPVHLYHFHWYASMIFLFVKLFPPLG